MPARTETKSYAGEIVASRNSAKSLLETDVAVGPAVPLAHVDVDDAVLARSEVVEVGDRRGAHFPVARLEARVAVEERRGKQHLLHEGLLLAAAEEFLAARPLRRDIARRPGSAGPLPTVSLTAESVRNVSAEDGVVALQHVLAVGIQ